MAIAGIKEASRLIFVDELTGLYNRRFMRQYLRERLNQFLESRTSLSVLMFDLDGFKEVNDTHGHMEGDLVLKRLAELIRGAVPAGSYAIRFAGDEFIVFVEGINGDGGLKVAEDIREAVATCSFCTQKVPGGISLSVSVGVACWPDDASTASDLIEAADAALYASKNAGKNQVTRSSGSGLTPEEEFRKRLPCPQLIGRQTEFDELLRPLAFPSGPKHRFLLVEGHKGLGKSRVLNEVLQSHEATRARCFFQLCDEGQQAMPYSMLARSISDCLRREPQQVESLRSRLSDEQVRALATVVPALADDSTTEDDADSVASPEQRSMLFHSIEEALCLLSQESALVLFLDDIQMADDASLEVLTQVLTDEIGDIVVYAACRTDSVNDEDHTSALLRLFTELCESPNFMVVSLVPLTPPEIEQLLASVLKQYVPSPPFLQQLFEASGGIPLFVEETLKGLIASGSLQFGDEGWDLEAVSPAAIPASLEAAVYDGLAVLDEETQAMISKAAVAGPTIDLKVLADALGKDPGETQELVDRGKEQRVFEEHGPLADEDEVRFLSECFREVVYQGISKEAKRKAHREVGEAKERAAKRTGRKDLGSLAYHFARSDDQAKAKHYGQRVKRVASQLFSAIELHQELHNSLHLGNEKPLEPLDQKGMELAQKFLKSLPLAIKNLRLYPQGNLLVQQSVASATNELLDLLQTTEAAGFEEENKVLLANGTVVPLEASGLEAAAHDLLKIYDDHAVRRCTFDRGITAADVNGVLRLLSDKPAGRHLEPAEWVERMSEAGIEHARVFPVIYLESEGKDERWRRDQSDRVDQETLPIVRNVLRSLAAVVDNIRLYPSESEVVTSTLDQLANQTDELFEHIPSLTVAKAQGTIVINAIRANPRQFGITVEILEKLIEDNGLVSLTLRAGVSRVELRAFLTRLAQPPEAVEQTPEYWQSVLEDSGIQHIDVGSLTYATAGAEESSSEEDEHEEAVDDEDLKRVEAWLEAPLDDYLAPATQREVATMLAHLHAEERQTLAKQLAERTLAALTQSEADARQLATEGVTIWLEAVEDLDWILDTILLTVADAIASETELTAFGSQTALSGKLLEHILGRGELVRGQRLASALVESTRDKKRERGWAAAVRQILDTLGDQLLELLLQCDDVETGRIAAQLLRTQGPNTMRALRGKLEGTNAADQTGRILAVLEEIEPAPGPELFFLLSHPNSKVRGDMAEALTRLERAEAVKFLRRAITQPDPEIVLGALGGVWQLGGDDLLEAVLGLIKEPTNDQVLTAAAQWLGTVQDKRTVGVLVDIMLRPPRLFRLIRGNPESARVAAARALAEVRMPAAREGLRKALKDPCLSVRAAARQSLA